MKRFLAIVILSSLAIPYNSFAQNKKAAKKSNVQTESGFIQMGGGLEYKVVKKGDGEITPKTGDYIELFITLSVDDSVIFDTRQAMDSDKPAPMQLAHSSFKGDLVNVLALMHEGDEVIALVAIDSMIKAGVPTAPWMRVNEGQKMKYEVTMVTVKPAAVKAQEDKDAAIKQAEDDDRFINEYLKQNKLTAKKTASGLYYIIEREGKGDNARQGQIVSVNYTGMLLDEMVFDSNVLPEFNHVEPFSFPLGRGSVIKGWDEGIGLLNIGAKAKLLIPSGLAYGARPNGKIPANAVLIFDVELMDIKSMGGNEQSGQLEPESSTSDHNH